MNKKTASILFFIVSTIINILIVLVLMVALFFIFYIPLKANVMRTLPIIFMIGVLGGSIISQRLMTYIFDKYHLEEKMEPLFNFKGKNKKNHPED